ncbi:MAG TPA: DsbA family protein [Solirubrobacteraceae bacterium]|nr:DsbA family protein [Solirubrobacteraceae bacterium]
MSSPIFYYDLSSPYSYLAAVRVDDVLPVRPEWRPIAFGVIVQRIGKVPWSFAEDRSADFEAIARRASETGLPPVVYPEGWPVKTYSIAALRAALAVEDQDERRALTLELYRTAFAEGRHLADADTVLDAAERAGLDRERIATAIASPEIKELLRTETDAAIARGVTGVPTVAIGERLFWGDDRLEDAAAA